MRTWLFPLACFLFSCGLKEDCSLDPNTDEFQISFHLDQVSAFTFDSIKNDVLSEVLFDSDFSFSTVRLPLTHRLDRMTYTFFTDSIDYTLTLRYQSRLNLYGDDCPPSVYFFGLVVESHNFEKVEVVNSSVDRRITENIKVFFQLTDP